MTNAPEFNAANDAETSIWPNFEAELTATTKATVVSGHGYPAERREISPEPTGWQASGAASTTLGSTGQLTEVSRETFR